MTSHAVMVFDWDSKVGLKVALNLLLLLGLPGPVTQILKSGGLSSLHGGVRPPQ